MVLNADFTLQLARDRQADLRREHLGPADAAVAPVAFRRRLGAWIVRLGRTVEGAALPRPALQA